VRLATSSKQVSAIDEVGVVLTSLSRAVVIRGGLLDASREQDAPRV